MAGRKQHYIPQSFQRGFCIPGKNHQTNVYSRKKNYTSNINNVAAQRDFYSAPSSSGEKTLDDSITFYENRLGDLLHSLRLLEVGDIANPKASAEIIAHLTPRTNSARNIIKNSAKLFISEASEIFAEKNELLFHLGWNKASTNPVWNKLFLPLIENEEDFTNLLTQFNAQIKIPKEVFYRMLFILSKESILSENNPLPYLVSLLFEKLTTQTDEMVIQGQKKILREDLTVKSRKKILESYKWHINAAPTEGAIMPDCIAIGLDEVDNVFYPYIMTSKASIVIMPLTSQKILIGVDKDCTLPDLSDFNKEASECSDELFISALPNHISLQENIGTRWRKKIESTVSNTIDKMKALQNPKKNNSYLSKPSSYKLVFTDSISELNEFIINKKIKDVIKKTSNLDLTRLEKITFTSNFQKTISETKRGFDTNLIPEGAPDFIAQGAALVLVLRNNKLKTHLVLDNNYALAILQKPKSSTCITSHILVASFSFSNIVDKFERKLSGYLMEPSSIENYDSTLHTSIRKAIRAYKYAYDSAEFGAKRIFEKEFSNYIIKSLESYYPLIDNAKKSHAIDQDFQKLFITIHNAITGILIDSARFIGHMEGIGENPVKTNTEITAKLNALQLTGWVNVFAYDLRNFWQKEEWQHEDFYALNIHFERLLYPKGILIYDAGDEGGTTIFTSNNNWST
tara:strand:+ start:2464 stop:4521 length:2058 start_codon:yes stop_codon:yes gene_type:complete